MSAAETFLKAYDFNRTRTLDLLDRVLKEPDPIKVLGWRPGPGRAHIAWQLMHIGVTEELFATERLAPHKTGAFQELWPRFRGGSTPDDDIPSADLIRQVLDDGRAHLRQTLLEIPDARLGDIPPTLAAIGKLTFQRRALHPRLARSRTTKARPTSRSTSTRRATSEVMTTPLRSSDEPRPTISATCSPPVGNRKRSSGNCTTTSCACSPPAKSCSPASSATKTRSSPRSTSRCSRSTTCCSSARRDRPRAG